MLLSVYWDSKDALQDALPKNWKDLESWAKDSTFGVTSFWKKYIPNNFWVVVPGKIYRSGIPWTFQVEELHGMHGIQNIVSLLWGSWLDEDELSKMWISHFQYDILQRRALTKERVQWIVRFIQELEWPTLIHCLKWSTRTGQVVAWYQLWVEWLSRINVIAHALRHGLVNVSSYRNISEY